MTEVERTERIDAIMDALGKQVPSPSAYMHMNK
jgi:hypothetical protein